MHCEACSRSMGRARSPFPPHWISIGSWGGPTPESYPGRCAICSRRTPSGNRDGRRHGEADGAAAWEVPLDVQGSQGGDRRNRRRD